MASAGRGCRCSLAKVEDLGQRTDQKDLTAATLFTGVDFNPVD